MKSTCRINTPFEKFSLSHSGSLAQSDSTQFVITKTLHPTKRINDLQPLNRTKRNSRCWLHLTEHFAQKKTHGMTKYNNDNKNNNNSELSLYGVLLFFTVRLNNNQTQQTFAHHQHWLTHTLRCLSLVLVICILLAAFFPFVVITIWEESVKSLKKQIHLNSFYTQHKALSTPWQRSRCRHCR